MPVTTNMCEYDSCDKEFETETLEHYITLLKLHVDARHKPDTTSAKAEKAMPVYSYFLDLGKLKILAFWT